MRDHRGNCGVEVASRTRVALAWVLEDEKGPLGGDSGMGSIISREKGICKGPEVGMSLVWDLGPAKTPGWLDWGE